jgi:flagellar basal-body rod protein FlgF
MKNAGYIALSQHHTQLRHMEMIANNIANASTTAFTGERAMFSTFMSRQPDGQSLAYVQEKGSKRDTREGNLVTTKNDLDIALRGPGYLVVKIADGNAYTRNGHLRLDATRRLTSESGAPVLGETGNEIQIDANQSDITIRRDGGILVNGRQIDRLQIVSFADEQALKKAGDGVFKSNQTPTPATQTEVRQGMIEESNVRPIVEITQMMAIVRNYQTAQNFLDGEHQRQLKAIRELPRTDQG